MNNMSFTANLVTALSVLVFWVQPVLAQDEEPAQEVKASGENLDKTDILRAPDQPSVRKVFTRQEIQRFCAQHNNSLIAYYGEVYQVDKCTRRVIQNSKTLARMIAKGAKVQDVDGDVIAAIPEGEPLDNELIRQSVRSCKELKGQYVSYSAVDVYFVEGCKRRLLPDWTTYIDHRDVRDGERGEIIALSWEEFVALEEGARIPSVVDDMFARLLQGDAGVDIIPVDEACEGINGKVVTYYDKMYQIEKCRKREILNPGDVLQGYIEKTTKFHELTSQQWLSLPSGAPVGKKKENGPNPNGKG
jgi:hypothetical protein